MPKEQKQSNALIIIPESIQTKIYIVRAQKVMLDIELAILYGVEPRTLNQAVKRNIHRFPLDFMFKLDNSDRLSLRSQFVIVRIGNKTRKRPTFAFTEQGIAMLSSVLRSDRAIQVNIQIMRTFTKLRELLLTHAELKEKIDELENKYDGQFRDVFEAIHVLIAEGSKP
ncbi:MAG: hypothetical protein RJB39_61 [Candidatus Parcubacteria bacterium]|jgi:phage regulator Rha-like protein